MPAGGVGLLPFGIRPGVAATILFHLEGIENAGQRTDEAHGEKGEIGGDFELGAGHFAHLAVGPGQANRLDRLEATLLADESLGGDGPVALAAFIVRRRSAHAQRPVGPGQRAVFLLGRTWHQLDLGDAGGAVAIRGADAVGAGIATANDDDMLALDVDRILCARRRLPCSAGSGTRARNARRPDRVREPAGRADTRHRRPAPRHRNPSCRRSALMVLRASLATPLGSTAFVTMVPVTNLTPSTFICAMRQSIRRLSSLKSGMPKRSRPPMRIVLLEHGDLMADAGQLLRGRQTGRAGTDNGDLLAGFRGGGCGTTQPFSPALSMMARSIDLMPTGCLRNVQRAGRFAGRRADAAGEFGKVVGRMQDLDGLAASARDRPGRSSRE